MLTKMETLWSSFDVTMHHRLGRIPLLLALIASIIQSVDSQCSGTVMVLNATDNYQVFTSLNYPTGYSNQQSCEWRLEADNVTDAIRLEITDAEIEEHPECVYDYGEVFDGDNVNATSLGRFCGTANPYFVSTSNNMTVTFSSDYSMSKKGFKARYKSGPRSSLIDEETESSSYMMFIIAGGAGGAAIILVVVAIIICKKSQSKNLKDVRPIQVQPFAVTSTWSQRDHHPPPVYGDGNVSTVSPPPRYSDVGLQPPTIIGKQGDGIRNTHFTMPENLRRTSTQIGNTTNGIHSMTAGTVTTGIANSANPDSLPNEDTTSDAGGNTIQTTANTSSTEASVGESNESGGTAENSAPSESGTGASALNANESVVPAPQPVNLLSLPRRNVPGETLSELLSDSEDDSETDSDEYDDSDAN